jgi:hypothetical protein
MNPLRQMKSVDQNPDIDIAERSPVDAPFGSIKSMEVHLAITLWLRPTKITRSQTHVLRAITSMRRNIAPSEASCLDSRPRAAYF